MRTRARDLKKRIQTAAAHPGVQKYFFNTGWMFAEKGLRLVAGVFIGAYVARYLGPAQYGLLNYVISLVSLFSVLASLGLDSIIIRELVRDGAKRDIILGTAFVLRMVGAVLMFLLLTIMVSATGTDRPTTILIYIIACGSLFEIFGIIDFFFQSKVWSKYVVWSQMISLAIISVFRIVLVFKHAPLVWFAWTSTLDFLLIAFGLVFFYTKNTFNLLTWRFSSRKARELLTQSWPLIFSSLAITVYMKIDQVMIKWMLGDVANGNYGVAVRLSEMWNFIPVAIGASLFPAILNAKAISEELYLTRLGWLYDLMVGVSLAIAIPMTFLSGFIVRILFGDAYSGAGDVLALYVWSGVFTFLGVANGKWIISENLNLFRMVSLVVAGIMNVILNYFLIHSVGLNGAAIATLIAYSFAGYFSFLFTRETRGMFFLMSRSFNVLRLWGIMFRKL